MSWGPDDEPTVRRRGQRAVVLPTPAVPATRPKGLIYKSMKKLGRLGAVDASYVPHHVRSADTAPKKIPLPPCCGNAACHIQLRHFKGDERELYTVYCGWLRKHGRMGLGDVQELLKTYDCDSDVQTAFGKVASRPCLSFDEFRVLVEDVGAADAIVGKRQAAYRAPPSDLRHLYGAFDTSGDGLLDMVELRAALGELGLSKVSDGRLRSLVDGPVDFPQFVDLVTLLRRQPKSHRTGDIGAGALIADAERLIEESTDRKVRVLDDGSVDVTFDKELKLKLIATPGYPLQAPRASFSKRIFNVEHLQVGLDGRTRVHQLPWDGDLSSYIDQILTLVVHR